MNRSTTSAKSSGLHRAGHRAGTASAALPFSIDHILSSPADQAAAVQAAVTQQQAAAMMMMGGQDMVSMSMLNEQLALLSQQQRHQHLMNPAALAVAAAATSNSPQGPQHLPSQQAQWQQQQQLMAAAANLMAAQQHHPQNALPNLAAVNPLASTAPPSAPSFQSSPNFLSCFMAYMLLQQQQQQQQQPHLLSSLPPQHAQQLSQLSSDGSPNMNLINSMTSPIKMNANSNIKQNQATLNRNSPYDSISGINGLSRLSPVSSHTSRDSRARDNPRLTKSPQLVNSANSNNENNRMIQRSIINKQGSLHETNQSLGANLDIISNSHEHNVKSSVKNNDLEPTALSSLSNFVTESLAPILNGDNSSKLIGATSSKDHQTQRMFKSSLKSSLNTNDYLFNNKSNSPTGSIKSTSNYQNNSCVKNNKYHNNSGNNSQHRKSNSLCDLEDDRDNNNNNSNNEYGDRQNELANNNKNTLDLISSAAQALKSSNANGINTTLAKADPELVQKQPAWVFCTRYSDRPSSGPRTRRAKSKDKKAKDPRVSADEKRPRTAFTSEQLEKLRQEFQANSYLDEKRRKDLAERLCLNENQIKIWFQNKRAKMKKQNNQPNPLRGLLVAGGLYNHSTATSDCSESYANGNDQEDDENDCADEVDPLEIEPQPNGHSTGQKRQRHVSVETGDDEDDDFREGADDDGYSKFRTQNDGSLENQAAKRTKLNHHGADTSDTDSNPIDVDERVISVS